MGKDTGKLKAKVKTQDDLILDARREGIIFGRRQAQYKVTDEIVSAGIRWCNNILVELLQYTQRDAALRDALHAATTALSEAEKAMRLMYRREKNDG